MIKRYSIFSPNHNALLSRITKTITHHLITQSSHTQPTKKYALLPLMYHYAAAVDILMQVSGNRQCRGASSSSRRPTAPRRHCFHRRSQRPHMSELRLMMPRRCLIIVMQSGSTNGARQPCHCHAQESTDGTKMPGHRQCLPSEEEEGRVSHPPGKMRSVPNGARNKWTRAVCDGGVGRRRVWLVTVVRRGRRGGEHNNQPKEGCAGCRRQRQ
jgi:hypothetical protein